MASGTNRKILSDATLATGKKGKDTFNAYARGVTGNANSTVKAKGTKKGK